ncbi:MAG TPA: hypothetical protein VNQ48_00140 [Microbacteriaceae bacterium]|nr:hypothetical protein [Microbacteriaceae bacterium]
MRGAAARAVTASAEPAHVDSLGVLPWVVTYKPEVIAIDVGRVSGRRFVFDPEPHATLAEPSRAEPSRAEPRSGR